MTLKVIALDLERTLITNILNRKPRPGLYEFLTFCLNEFQRVAIFTAVPDKATWEVLRELADKGAVPQEFLQRAEYVYWDGEYKDLRYVPDADVSEIIILDDFKGYILPEQERQWIPVYPYIPPGVNPWLHMDLQPELEMDDDQELEFIQKKLLEPLLGKTEG